jgi:hypothetical protein
MEQGRIVDVNDNKANFQTCVAGHLLPALRVAQGFAESGHSVTLFTSSCVSAGLAKAPESAGVRVILLDDFPAQDAVDSLISTEKGHVVFPTLENTTYPYAVKALAELHAREPIDHCVIDFVTFAFHKVRPQRSPCTCIVAYGHCSHI